MDALDQFLSASKPKPRQAAPAPAAQDTQPRPQPSNDDALCSSMDSASLNSKLPAAEEKPAAKVEATKAAVAWGYHEEANPNYRNYMEDDHCVVEAFNGRDSDYYFGLYDGHGGRIAVDFVVARLHDVLAEELQANPVEDALNSSFLKVDNMLQKAGAWRCGSTIAVCLVQKVPSRGHVLYVANCGDSRVTLCTKGSAERLSYDDKCTDFQEMNRVVEDGGTIFRDRVCGSLAVTRSLGDHALKDSGVSGAPHIHERVLSPHDEFLVMASDGVWDVITDDECVEIVRGVQDSQLMSQLLVERAVEKGSRDNISALCIRLNVL